MKDALAVVLPAELDGQPLLPLADVARKIAVGRRLSDLDRISLVTPAQDYLQKAEARGVSWQVAVEEIARLGYVQTFVETILDCHANPIGFLDSFANEIRAGRVMRSPAHIRALIIDPFDQAPEDIRAFLSHVVRGVSNDPRIIPLAFAPPTQPARVPGYA